MKNNDLYVVLPYIRTKERVRFPGLEFRSSGDLDGLPEDAQRHLRTLCGTFYVRDGVRIKEMTCASVEAKEGSEQAVRDAHQLIAYLYTAPLLDSPSLPYEEASLFLFRPELVPALLLGWPEEDDRVEMAGGTSRAGEWVEGYEGLRNWQVRLWADVGSRIYPELPSLRLNAWEYLSAKLQRLLGRAENWAFNNFWFGPSRHVAEDVRRRVRTALEWHGRSCRQGLTSAEAIANLAIALEALLKVPEGQDLTRRFSEAVMTLLGPVPRLDSWLHQFYEARSKTVHEGAPHADMFYAADKADLGKSGRPKSPVAPLLDYGHRVFHLCLVAVVSSAVAVCRAELASSFVANRERVEQIHKALNEQDATAAERLAKARGPVMGLTIPWSPEGEGEATFEAVRSAANALALAYQQTSPSLSAHAAGAVREVAEGKAADDQDCLDRMSRLVPLLKEAVQQGLDRQLAGTLGAFLEYATSAHFRLLVARRSW